MHLRQTLPRLLIGTLLCFPMTAWSQCLPGEVTLPADRDNTLYEDATGNLSNGAGQYIFTGNTLANGVRRALVHFDVAGTVPAGSVITSAALRLEMSMTRGGAEDVNLHAAGADWGEGTSTAPGEEGGGTLATAGDATWLHTFFDTDLWMAPGGDFAAAASATTIVDGAGPYSWDSAGTVSDVQGWLDDPASNFGWILIGNEAMQLTAKRFDSRENADPMATPLLCVGFGPPPAVAIPTLGDFGLLLMALCLAGLAVRRQFIQAETRSSTP